MKLFPLIPTGWEICQLHKVAQKCTKKNKDHNISLVLTNSAVHGVVPQSEHFNKEIATDENIRDYYVIEPGEFVYNPRISVTASCGPIRRNHLGFRGVMSPLYTIFKLKNRKADDRYLEYYFLSPSWHKFAKSVANYGARHDRMAIKDDDFFAMPIPLPPLSEQKRIAEILIEQDKLIALKERLIAAKKKQKKWLMQNILTGKIRLEGFSDEWEKLRLGDVCKTFSGGTPLKDKGDYYNGKIKWIRSGELNSKRIYETAQTLTIDGFSNSSAKFVKPGTLLLALYGATAGVCAITMVEACINQAVLAIIPQKKLENNFLLYLLTYLMYTAVKKYTQGGQPNFSAEIIKSLKLIVPSIPEQIAIAERLSAADQEIELLTKELEAQKQIKKYLMQQLLTGKIRVTGGES